MFKRLLGLCLVFGMAATAPPALAASCGARADVIHQLQSKYAEKLTAGGLQTGSGITSVIEVWSSETTGTFTVLLTHANGISCIVSAGTNFYSIVPVKAPEGAAS